VVDRGLAGREESDRCLGGDHDPAFSRGAAGYAEQRHYDRDRYTSAPGLPPLSELWQWARTVRHARIAIVDTFGGFFAYPLLGLDDSNDVQYVGHHDRHHSLTQRMDARSRLLTRGDWTKHDPAAQSVLRQDAHAPIAVYELTGRLDPDRCSDTDQPTTAQLSL
jgi:hypothetical protein